MWYTKQYTDMLAKVEKTKQATLSEMTKRIRKYGKPICIGNMEYFYCQHPNTKEIVPAYKYANEHTAFEPIYDKDYTYDYGWSDFAECCRIFDVISKFLLEYHC